MLLAFARPNLVLIALVTDCPLLTTVYRATLDGNLGSRTAMPVRFGRVVTQDVDPKTVLTAVKAQLQDIYSRDVQPQLA